MDQDAHQPQRVVPATVQKNNRFQNLPAFDRSVRSHSSGKSVLAVSC